MKEAQTRKEETKKAIQQRMNLRDEPNNDGSLRTTAAFAPPDDESYIDVDISNALPLAKWVQPDDYSGGIWKVFLTPD
jgi:hypothetical protein